MISRNPQKTTNRPISLGKSSKKSKLQILSEPGGSLLQSKPLFWLFSPVNLGQNGSNGSNGLKTTLKKNENSVRSGSRGRVLELRMKSKVFFLTIPLVGSWKTRLVPETGVLGLQVFQLCLKYILNILYYTAHTILYSWSNPITVVLINLR